jgi:hypothetical protein
LQIAEEFSVEIGLQTDGRLLQSLKQRLPALEKALERLTDVCFREDLVYRAYSGSFKVEFYREDLRAAIVLLENLAPTERGLCKEFKKVLAGDGGRDEYLTMADVYFHVRFFLEMAVKYGRELDEPPSSLPFGWAALLSLYQIR